MAIDADRLALVRATVKRLRGDMPDASVAFYQSLFERAPSLRDMSREDIEGQGMKFMTTLGVLVDRFDHPEDMQAEIRELARGHAAYGVKAEHFAPMRSALLGTLKERLGEDFTPAVEEAWGNLYDAVADAMIEEMKGG